MLIEKAEQRLREKFKFDFEFKESKVADLESSLFFVLAKKKKKSPQQIADTYLCEIKEFFSDFRVEFSSGFLNFFFKKEALIKELKRLLLEKEDFFRVKGRKKKINLEFVSANPTGPLHLGNLRGAPAGEVLSQVFRWRGNEVIKEYYVNDLGTQTENFLETVIYWLADSAYSFPEGGYKGDYPRQIALKLKKKREIKDLIEDFKSQKITLTKVKEKLRPKVISLSLADIFKTLKKIGVSFDVVSNESSLKSDLVLKKLNKKGCTLKKEGAVWFISPKHKDLLGDRECVLVRSDGRPTYFLNDIAYHLDKVKRGAEEMIDVWGANHFGHKPRLKAALEVLDAKANLEIVFYQPVRLKKAGEVLLMAKRKGTYITADQVLDLVEPDVFKVYLLSRTLNAPLDFDLDLFKKEAKKSPVYYLKYMSARIYGILAKVEEPNVEANYKKLGDYEMDLIKRFVLLPYKIYKTAQLLEPHFIYEEALRFAESFHRFYDNCPLKDEKDLGLKKARFEILKGALLTAQVLAQILGIDLPQKM